MPETEKRLEEENRPPDVIYALERMRQDQPKYDFIGTLPKLMVLLEASSDDARDFAVTLSCKREQIEETWRFTMPIFERGRLQQVADTYEPSDLVEFGAITLVLAIQFNRFNVRLRTVTRRRGGGFDYYLERPNGEDAGVLEVGGISSGSIISKAKSKRKQVSKNERRPQWVGVIKFSNQTARLWLTAY